MSKLEFGHIGVGNCGNQIVDGLFEAGFERVLAVNMSDLDLSQINKEIPRITLGGLGCGNERGIARKKIIDHHIDFIENSTHMQEILKANIIVGHSSMSGGSGGGSIPPLLDILKSIYPSKIFIAVGVGPDNMADIKMAANALDYMREIKELNIPLMPYSNAKGKGKNVKEIMEYINKNIVEDMEILSGKYSYPSKHRMIDDRDNLKVISTPGIMTISKIRKLTEKDLDQNNISKLMIDAVRDNSFMEMDKDKIIRRMAVITNVKDTVLNKVDRNYTEFKEEFGEPIEVFENLSDISNIEEVDVATCVIMAGLSYPEDECAKLDEKVKRANEVLSRKSENKFLSGGSSTALLDEDFSQTLIEEGAERKSATDIGSVLDKYRR